MTCPKIFLIGHMGADDHPHLADFLSWYIEHLRIPPANLIMGVRNDPENTNAPLVRCGEIFDRFQVPRWSELWLDVDIADWRRNEQDTYVRDIDWVVHARIGDFLRVEWTNDCLASLADWMDHYEFDCVMGEIVERFAMRKLPAGRTPWELYPHRAETNQRQVAMARGYWYVCDDGMLCPQFQESAWAFPRPIDIHRFTYQIR